MASPQTQDGYTAIARELMDALCSLRINGEGWQVLMAIMRLTYGYKKKETVITSKDLVKMCGIEKRQVNRVLARLAAQYVIKRDAQNMTSVNKDYEAWETSNRIVDKSKTGGTENAHFRDRKRPEVGQKTPTPSYIERNREKKLKERTDDKKIGDKSEGRRRMEAARSLLAEKMTM